MSRTKKYLLLLATMFVLMFGSAMAVNAASQTMRATQTKATSSSITLSWTTTTSYGVDHYAVAYCLLNKDASTAEVINYITKNTATINGLSLAKGYNVQVAALDSAGNILDTSVPIIMYTIPGKISSYNLVGSDNDGTGLTFYSKTVPYENSATYSGALRGIQWKLTDLSGKTVKTGTTTSTKFKANVATNRCYNFYVRGYTTINGNRRYGVWSTKKLVVPQPKMYVPTLASGMRLNVKWKKVSGATSYIIYGSTSKTSGYKKIATVSSSKSSYVVSKILGKKLVKNKKYYIKVRAVRSGTNSPVTNYAYVTIY